MKKFSRLFPILLFVFGVVACVAATSDNTPKQPATATSHPPSSPLVPTTHPALENTPTQTPKPTAMVATPTMTSTPSPTAFPTQPVVMPTNVWMCPTPFEVPLEKFGLDDYFLLGRLRDRHNPGKLSEAILIDLQQGALQTVPGSQPKEGWRLRNYKMAADGRSIELLYEEINGNRREIWHSSWDGTQRTLVASFSLPPLPSSEKGYEYGYQQIDDTWFAAMKSNWETYTNYPIFLYNWVTGETRKMPPFPEGASVYNFYVVDGTKYMLMERWLDTQQIELYNLENFTATPAFQWLLHGAWDEIFTSITYMDGLFYIEVFHDTLKMDLAMELDLETVLSNRTYQQAMHPIHLQGASTINSTDFIAYGAFLHNAPLYLFAYPGRFEQGVSLVHLLDLNDNIVTNYCYPDRGEPQDWGYFSPSISPDQKFVAFTPDAIRPEDLINGISSYRVEILNLQTGELATISIPNFDIVGWGKK